MGKRKGKERDEKYHTSSPDFPFCLRPAGMNIVAFCLANESASYDNSSTEHVT
jgi:hypothetical protein